MVSGRLALLDPSRGSVATAVNVFYDADTGSIDRVEVGRRGQSYDEQHLVLPALVDWHDHGRGVSPLAYGASDERLELWLHHLLDHPFVDTKLLLSAAFAKLARSGVGSVVHCHNSQHPEALIDEARDAFWAAEQVGIRIAFVVPLCDRNVLGYGADECILRRVRDPDDRRAIERTWKPSMPAIEQQFAMIDRISSEVRSPLQTVQWGPVGPQWCSEKMLATLAERSERRDERVHMHLLETPYQRQWADAHYPQGLLRRLDELGVLNSRLTVAHGVWLRVDEIELLAERGVTVVINTSSNLRLRSGLAPVREMMAARLRLGIGLDGLALDDDQDMFRELHLTRLLHDGLDPTTETELSAAALLANATRPLGAANAIQNDGGLFPGAPADIAVVDRDGYAGDVAVNLVDEYDLLLGRCRSRHVRTLIVAGRIVVNAGEVAGIDEEAITAELLRECRHVAPTIRGRRRLARCFESALSGFYESGGHTEVAYGQQAPMAQTERNHRRQVRAVTRRRRGRT